MAENFLSAITVKQRTTIPNFSKPVIQPFSFPFTASPLSPERGFLFPSTQRNKKSRAKRG